MNSGKDRQKDQKDKAIYNYEKFLSLCIEFFGKTLTQVS